MVCPLAKLNCFVNSFCIITGFGTFLYKCLRLLMLYLLTVQKLHFLKESLILYSISSLVQVMYFHLSYFVGFIITYFVFLSNLYSRNLF